MRAIVLLAAVLLAAGPAMAGRPPSPPGKNKGVPVVVYSPTVTVTAGTVPGVTTTADRGRVPVGGTVTISSILSASTPATGIVWSYPVQPGFAVIGGTGPVAHTAPPGTARWVNPDGSTSTVEYSSPTLWVWEQPIVPVVAGGVVMIGCGDLEAERTVTVTERCNGS